MYDFLIDIIPREETVDYSHQPDSKVGYDPLYYGYVVFFALLSSRTPIK